MPLCLGSVVLPINSEDFRHQQGKHVIYGDPEYGLAYNIISPFRGAKLTNDEQTFNTQMSRVRASVEWDFGKIIMSKLCLFRFLEKPHGFASTGWKVLLGCFYFGELSYIPIWFPNKHLL